MADPDSSTDDDASSFTSGTSAASWEDEVCGTPDALARWSTESPDAPAVSINADGAVWPNGVTAAVRMPPRVTVRCGDAAWWDAAVPMFSGATLLRTLCVRRRAHFTDTTLAALPATLEALDICDCRGITHAARFSHLPALKTLVCDFLDIGTLGFASLPPSLQKLTHDLDAEVLYHHLPALVTLECTFARLTDAAVASLPPTLRVLRAHGTHLTAAVRFAHLPALRSVDVQSTNVGEAALASLPPTLRRLYCHLSDAAVAALPPALEALEVATNEERALHLTLNAELAGLTALAFLFVRSAAIGDDTIAVLPVTLRALDIRFCAAISEAVRFNHLLALQELECDVTRVGDAALASLPPCLHRLSCGSCSAVTSAVRFGHLPELRSLTCCETADDDVIASLPPSITRLYMSKCTAITPALRLAHLPLLRVLRCQHIRVSNASIASLPRSVHTLELVNYDALTPAVRFDHLTGLRRVVLEGLPLGPLALASIPQTVRREYVGEYPDDDDNGDGDGDDASNT